MDLVAFFIFRWSLLLFETVFASIPFFVHKEKHKYHYLRIIACIAIDIGLIVGLSYFQYFIFSTFGFDKLYYTIFGLAYYLIFFGFHVASIQFIFKGKLYNNFSLITKSYAIRQLAFVIYILIVILIVKQVTNPLSQLQVEMDKIKDLDYLTRKNTYLSGSKEIIQLNSTFNDMMVRIRDLTSKLVDERDAQRKSELKALQNQINPHFLYNTLDSIIFMIEKNENEKAEQMIVALSKFFRISISRGKNIIPLKDEIEHVKNYLLIQKIRFGDQFSYSINVEETLYKYYVIKLILQPIVENAIEHGLDEYSNDGKIEIDGKEDEEFIILSVKDNGFGISEEKLKEIEDSFHDKNIHKGVGLQNVYQRIKIYYGEKADIKINSVIDEGTTIFIYIPKRKALNNDEDKV